MEKQKLICHTCHKVFINEGLDLPLYFFYQKIRRGDTTYTTDYQFCSKECFGKYKKASSVDASFQEGSNQTALQILELFKKVLSKHTHIQCGTFEKEFEQEVKDYLALKKKYK